MRIRAFLKKKIALVLAVCFAATGLLIELYSQSFYRAIPEQNAALYFGTDQAPFTQISLFMTEGAGFGKNSLMALRGSVNKKIGEKTDSSSVSGRTFIDAYSAKNKLRFSSDKTKADIETFGVGGDFFIFHPFEVLSGSIFSEATDENHDGIVLNELAAWQLFGAIDVAGMYVNVGDMELSVRGVVKEPEGPFKKASGQEEKRAYIAYEAMERALGGGSSLGITAGGTSGTSGITAAGSDAVRETSPVYITCYEALVLNPVKSFGVDALSEGAKSAGLSEGTYELLENTARFSYLKRLELFTSFFTRVMKDSAMVYPYWENGARAAEQLLLLLIFLELLFFVAAFVLLVIGLVSLSDEFRRFSVFLKGRRDRLHELIIGVQRRALERKQKP